MDESSLRAQLNNLDVLRSSLHSSFRFWDWVVVVGVALEFIVLVWEYRDERRAWLRETILPEEPKTWLFLIGFLGIAMVAGGISKELGIDSQIESVETQIRGVNAQLFGIVSKEAEDASMKSQLAKDKSDIADVKAGKAQEKADDVDKQAKDLSGKLQTATTELEAVDAKRAELEKSLINLAVCTAPRVIPLLSIAKEKTSVDPLRGFAREAIIEFVPDAETRRAAYNIVRALDTAGWKISKFTSVDGIDDGVDIQPYIAPSPALPTEEWGSLLDAEQHATEAADIVVDFLHSYNWQARRGWPIDENHQLIRDPKIMPPGSLRIRVGLYPAVEYVSPPGAKDFTAAMAKAEEESEKERKQIEAAQLKREEERLKSLTPQQAEEYKATMERWRNEERLREARYTNPCQPLTPLFPNVR